MAVYLRHKKLPLAIIYRDPKKTWDKGIKKFFLEEMKKDSFKNFAESDVSMEEYLEEMMGHI